MEIKNSHQNYAVRLHPLRQEWPEAISLLRMVHKPAKPGCRLCLACLSETPAILSMCLACKGHLISHGWRQRLKMTVTDENIDINPENEDVKDPVKQAREHVKEEESVDDDDDIPEEEPSLGGVSEANQEEDDEEVKDPKEEAKDDADEPMDDEQAKSEEPEEDEDDEMDIGKFEEEEVRDAMEYPRWMERVQFGSRTLPAHPCMIGDAQPDFVNLILLQMGSNINHIIKNFHRNFCGPVGNLWKHFQSHNDLRVDLDPKIPYIGLDDNGDLIEPDEYHLRHQYQTVGRPDSPDDLGEDGFVRSYQGSLIFKRLVVYVLERGFAPDDFRERFSTKGCRVNPKDTKEEEEEKARLAMIELEEQAEFMRRVVAEAYNVKAVYFFRDVNYANTVFLDPLDITCAYRPGYRRIAVLDLILQNGVILPMPLMVKLIKANPNYNRSKQREGQRPQWGTHLSEACVLAIADTPVPEDMRGTSAARTRASTTPTAKAASATSQTSSAAPASSRTTIATTSSASIPPPPAAAKAGPRQPPYSTIRKRRRTWKCWWASRIPPWRRLELHRIA